MRTADFDYFLPPDLIAQHPTPRRDESRLLVLDRASGRVDHRRFADLAAYLNPRDVLVLNNSRVIPARLRGVNERTGGRFEILLLEENARNDWWVMLRPGKRARVGTSITLLGADGNPAGVCAHVIEVNDEGHRRLIFDASQNLEDLLPQLGEVPLPPYITRSDSKDSTEDHERYQTVFAQPSGSVAAPTAGLHFTEALLEKIKTLGVNVQFVTLHVGLATFAPVKVETLAAHRMHVERYEVSATTAQAVNAARAAGRRVIAIGTTTVRVLETIAARHGGKLVAERDHTQIFIHPPYTFRLVDALLTNFHLPCSTLLMLVSAFAAPGATLGRDMVLTAYAEAIAERYRFFSYGDAMLLL
ncbi:MAG: tRNA preQ1(34) S-adenosylmethionine ribosyltransferase-isomerase QueA [Verrucomicrobiae bacterium]|nr:tRNA preQ1(34) S-adenosylmethionine ribosyltransferase-isomerase QueA [Verrucomicrobiae bacterium]